MICVDASVAVKWTVNEVLHDEAMTLVSHDQVLIAPDLVLLEVHNVLRRKLKKGEVSSEQFLQVSNDLPSVFDLLVPVRSLVTEAARLSVLLDHPIYDCLYLACAIKNDAVVVTADEHFARKVLESQYHKILLSLDQTTKLRLDERLRMSSAEVRALELWRVFDQTLTSVRAQVSRSFGSSGRPLYSTRDLQPAFESPAYLRLRRFMDALEIADRARLLALAWFGQSVDNENWDTVLRQAEDHFAGPDNDPIGYTISKFHTLDAGITRYQLISKTSL